MDKLNDKTVCLNSNYSTTKLCYKLIDDKYLDKNKKIKDEYKFKLNFPELGVINSKISAKENEKFDTYLFLPEGKERKEEGGLRTKGYFKNSLKNKPLISIITVVFNGEKYLEETIKSVINQTYDNIEYIIIDGGSTDKTLNIIKRYEDKIDYWISEKDKGIYDAMNKGLKLSMGEYIGILNADDFYVKDAIMCSVKQIMENDADYSIGNVKFVKGSVIKPIIPLKNEIYQEMPYPHVSALISKKIYKKIGLFDISLKIAGDHDMAIRILKQNFKYTYLNKILAYLHEGGISSSLQSNKESMKVAIKHGKNNYIAYYKYIISVIKVFVAKYVLPKRIVNIIQKIKKSRFHD